MVYAMLSIGILGFIVWSHHMYTVGLDVDTFVSKEGVRPPKYSLCAGILLIFGPPVIYAVGIIQKFNKSAGNKVCKKSINLCSPNNNTIKKFNSFLFSKEKLISFSLKLKFYSTYSWNEISDQLCINDHLVKHLYSIS